MSGAVPRPARPSMRTSQRGAASATNSPHPSSERPRPRGPTRGSASIARALPAIRAKMVGTSVRATSSETMWENEMVSAWSRINCPARPSTKTSGRNTATIVSVEAVTAIATSPAPRLAARWGSRPSSRLRQVLSPAPDGSRHRHRVGVAFLVDRDLDRLGAVDPRRDLGILGPAPHPGHVREPYHAPLARRQDDVADLGGVEKLVGGAHQVLRPALRERAARQVDVLLGEPARHVGERESHRGKARGVDLDLDLLLLAARDLDRRHPLGPFQVPLTGLAR